MGKKMTDNEKGFVAGIVYTCSYLIQLGFQPLAATLWQEAGFANKDVLHCAEYDVVNLRQVIPNLPKGKA